MQNKQTHDFVKMRARTTSQIDWWHARLTDVSLGGHSPSSGLHLLSSSSGLGCKIIEM